jgi:hypothetical protein
MTPRMLVFALTSLPIADEWNNVEDRESFRVGAGAVLTFGR